jgi:hypothetical protein
MKRISILIVVLTCFVWAAPSQAQPQTSVKIITFDVPGAGTGSGQGTFSFGMTPAGVLMGYYLDANYVFHGFVRAPLGAITMFDVNGAGTDPFYGTQPFSINPRGEITGYYTDASGLSHGFVRDPSGAITTFNVNGAGIPVGQPCSPPVICSNGTQGASINAAGAIAGQYVDTSGVFHGGRPRHLYHIRRWH